MHRVVCRSCNPFFDATTREPPPSGRLLPYIPWVKKNGMIYQREIPNETTASGFFLIRYPDPRSNHAFQFVLARDTDPPAKSATKMHIGGRDMILQGTTTPGDEGHLRLPLQFYRGVHLGLSAWDEWGEKVIGSPPDGGLDFVLPSGVKKCYTCKTRGPRHCHRKWNLCQNPEKKTEFQMTQTSPGEEN